jgi:hypothetical protein
LETSGGPYGSRLLSNPPGKPRKGKRKMKEFFTKKDIEKAGENLLWAQGLIGYVLRKGADLEEAESISVFYIMEMLLKDAVYIMDPLNHESMFRLLAEPEQEEKP